jgi:signal transduction histidine kinase
LNTRAIDLDELISSVITDYRNDPRLTTTGNDRRKREVKIKYEPKKVIVQADRDRIQQVISNLLSNALKFTPEGEITIRTEVKDGMAIVTVLDTGSGIDPEIRPRLFQKFASKSDKGTGLGLYISDNIIRAHGGRILAENNTDGVGSAFSFTLPLAK